VTDLSLTLGGILGTLRARLQHSKVPKMPMEEGDLSVMLAMPSWTIQRSTDRAYIYDRFCRLGEEFRINFCAADSAAYLISWNGQYLLHRAKQLCGVPLKDQVDAPPLKERSSVDAIFSYGSYPRGKAPAPVLWEQTFAPQRGVDSQAWRARLRMGFAAGAGRAAAVVTATDVSAQWFSDVFPEHRAKINVVPYYLPHLAGEFRRTTPQLGGSKRLIFVGKEARRKGLDTFAAAWPLIASRVRDRLQVDVVSAFVDGTVPLPREWRRSAFVPSVLECMRNADVLVFPTKQEAYGLVLVEAMSAGCAIITCDAPLQRAIVGAETGVFVDPTSPVQLARAIELLMSDSDRLASVQAASRARFDACLHPRLVGRAYAELLFRVAGRVSAGVARAAPGASG
jgi:glycosyltransferase involved in cell wall biosynthesis